MHTEGHTCIEPTPAAIRVDDDMALLKPPPPPAEVAAEGLDPPVSVAAATCCCCACFAAASLPAAAATLLVVTESNGTLNSFVVVLKTERATPTPASWLAPAGIQDNLYVRDSVTYS